MKSEPTEPEEVVEWIRKLPPPLMPTGLEERLLARAFAPVRPRAPLLSFLKTRLSIPSFGWEMSAAFAGILALGFYLGINSVPSKDASQIVSPFTYSTYMIFNYGVSL
jgi:hypothetical protein